MNVLLICMDTLRADMVHANGVDFIQTPNCDQLARSSIVFDNAYAEGLPTVPYRRCLMTGMRSFPWRFDYDTKGLWPTGHGWHKIPPEQTTLAELLLANGYTTGLIGDLYHIFKPTMNCTRGFASYEFIRGQESDNYKTGPLSAVDLARVVNEDNPDPRKYARLVQYLLNNQDRRSDDDWTSSQVFLRGAKWLEDNRDNQPFCLWLECFDPHEPWDPPKHYADRYCPGYTGKDLIDPHLCKTSGPEAERVKALYYGEVSLTDHYVGIVLDKLEELGLADNTIVVFTSDHGTELMDHDRFGKSAPHLHRYFSQVNLFLRVPGSPHNGRHIKAFAQNQDIFPTLTALLGIEHPPLDGHDLWPLVTGAAGSVHSDFVITGAGTHASVRNADWNYIVNYARPKTDERLYKLAEDPHEDRNVLSAHPEQAKKCRAALERLLGGALPFEPKQKPAAAFRPFMEWVGNSEAVRNWWGRRP